MKNRTRPTLTAFLLLLSLSSCADETLGELPASNAAPTDGVASVC